MTDVIEILLQNGGLMIAWAFGAMAFGFGRAMHRDLRQTRIEQERARELLERILNVEKRLEHKQTVHKGFFQLSPGHSLCPHCDSPMFCMLSYNHDECKPICSRQERCPGPPLRETNPDHPYR